MKFNFLTLVFILLVVVSCHNQKIVKAKIFERRQLEDARLLIKYRYNIGGKNYTDSAVIKNTVVSTDSINLIINPTQPGKSIPDLQGN
jgi:hypothetical protein